MAYWNGTGWDPEAPAEAPRRRPSRRLFGAAAEATLITLLTFGLIAGTTLAARGGNGGGGKPSSGGNGTISLAPLVADANGNGLANHGDTVRFDVWTNATTVPYVNLECHQNGALVLNGWKGYWDGSLDSNWNFGLASGAWQSGAAECTAYLTMQTRRGWSRLASTSFHVDG